METVHTPWLCLRKGPQVELVSFKTQLLAPEKSTDIFPILKSIDEGTIPASNAGMPSPAQARIGNIYPVRPKAFCRAAIEPSNNANVRGALPQCLQIRIPVRNKNHTIHLFGRIL